MADKVVTIESSAAAPKTEARTENRHSGPRPPRRNDRRDMPTEPKIFEEYVVSIDRVARVVKGGRRFRFKALVAVGDGKQRVGVGVAKGKDVQAAVMKASERAKKTLITLPIVNATIPHETAARKAGASIMLKPAAPGTGLIAGGTVRSIIALTGIHNIIGKAIGGNNKVNNAYATLDALKQLVPKEQWIKKHVAAEKKTPTATEVKK